MAADTGHGSTLTFGTSGFSASIVSMTGVKKSRPVINASHLGTTGAEEKIPGDLEDHEAFEIECHFTPGAAGSIPSTGVVETITKSYPTAAGQSTPGTYAGSGFIVDFTEPVLKTNEIMMSKLSVIFDGYTGPAFTPGS